MKNNNLLLSISMITYNHGKYISKAIEGVLNQKTNFHFQLVVSNDASTDNTHEIIIDYVRKFPDRIKYIHHKENLGVHQNLINNFNNCKSKYIAVCEGDDYWIDSGKLQKQVNFLEKHPDFSTTFHRSSILFEEEQKMIKSNSDFLVSKEFDFLEAYKKMIFQSGSLVFRKSALEYPLHFKNYVFPDNGIILGLRKHGKLYGFSDVMSVYRKHQGGLSNPSWGKAIDFEKMMKLIELDFGDEVKNVTKFRRYSRYKYMAKLYINNLDIYYFSLSLYKCFKFNPLHFLKKDFWILSFEYLKVFIYKKIL